jgi:hypothetical protein
MLGYSSNQNYNGNMAIYDMQGGTFYTPGSILSYIGDRNNGWFLLLDGICNVGSITLGAIPGTGKVGSGGLTATKGTMTLGGGLYLYRGSLSYQTGDAAKITAASCQIGSYNPTVFADLYAPSKTQPDWRNEPEWLKAVGVFRLVPGGRIICPSVSGGGRIICGSFSNRAGKSAIIQNKLTVTITRDDPDGTFEVFSGMEGGFGEDNAALSGLEVDSDFHLKYVDEYDNELRGIAGKECVFADYLSIADSSSLDVFAYYTYLPGDQTALMDAWIADGRLFSSLGAIEAVYQDDYNWTYVTPEPATLSLLALGGLALLRRRRA